MATTTEPRRAADKGIPTLATELWQLVVAYLKQETLDPLKGLLRFLGFGILGSALLSLGLLLWLLALLRALQTETGAHFTGNLSWLPYLMSLAAGGVVAGLAVRAIGSHKRKARRKGSVA
ncbi:MAG TPA: hypothetical protein VHM89_16240 [Acidimicrobiales bacterium]|nr:hypothetical protein [Acidimicrobiales bacterium]